MCEALFIGGLTVIYWVFQECGRRCKLNSLWLLFGFIPAVLAPIWAWANDVDGFWWLKMFSVFAGICWAGWLRFTYAGRIAIFRSVVPWILVINVGEAMLVDLLHAGIEHLMNALAAIMLILSMPKSEALVRVEEKSGFHDLQFDLPRSWIVGYTLWNWSFVNLNYPAYAGHHLAILFAALIVGGFDPKNWLQARAATLGLQLLCYASNPNALLSIHDASRWSNSYVVLLAPALACLWILIARWFECPRNTAYPAGISAQTDTTQKSMFSVCKTDSCNLRARYSGRDDSVMDALEDALTNGNAFPAGLFGCTEVMQPRCLKSASFFRRQIQLVLKLTSCPLTTSMRLRLVGHR